MKRIRYYSLPLFGNQFKGECHGLSQLAAKFQNWARQYGLDDDESLTLWLAGSGREVRAGIGSETEVSERALLLIGRLPKEQIIDLSEH